MGAVSEIELSSDVQWSNVSQVQSPPHYILLRWKGRPVGRMVIQGEHPLDLEVLRNRAMEASAAGLQSVEKEQAPEEPVSSSRVSVIVASRDRPAALAECLEALRRLEPPPGEILVVDSASEPGQEVARVAGEAGARYLRLEAPGLSRARNEGASAAGGEILAFVDDDCRMDRAWLQALCSGFSKPQVDAVTGLLLPAELDTDAQVLFMNYSHMDRRGFRIRCFRREVRQSRYWPLDVWRVGSGGNLAVRKKTFHRLGGFDTSLGLGTPSRGGEDLFFLWCLLQSGGIVEYRPDAMGWHRHHRTLEALKAVMVGYGRGHSAYLRAAVSAGAPLGTALLYMLSYYADRSLRLARCLAGRSTYPAALVLKEIAGSLTGYARR